ncbi:SCP2 sterol-binding domain-containing protein [Moraxella sp. ZY210820]|uniref:SCP2 sterol-binding domain-containing protein n=1 Tax=unclassified Moraxella TaxID=2685852 RepID=UPI00272F033D|nr:SCP2 sterol-binding domain-containing protein [Moraxella sp. ZY210820]WLF83229.1 SCP2 sterol-binding domain-containing protein [Moraxella sp. ZY210820]
MAQFLSQDWFNQVAELTTQAGDLNISNDIKALKINLITNGSQGITELSLADGQIVQGLHPNATTTLNLSEELLRKIFFERDMTAAMMGFMMGKIKIQGDMSQLSVLQHMQISPQHKELFKKILEISQ